MGWVEWLGIAAAFIAIVGFAFAASKWSRPVLSRLRLLAETSLDPLKPVEKPRLSYLDVQKGIDILVEKFGQATPDVILCIDRGGAIVGGIIAKRLRVPICLIPRCGKDLRSFDFGCLQQELEGQRILVVDDACRAGATLERVMKTTRDMLPKKTIKVAVLIATRVTYSAHKQETGLSLVDYFAYFTSKTDVWLPWDVR